MRVDLPIRSLGQMQRKRSVSLQSGASGCKQINTGLTVTENYRCFVSGTCARLEQIVATTVA